MRRVNSGSVDKIYLTRDEWFLGALPMHGDKVDFSRLSGNDEVPVPIKVTPSSIDQAYECIRRAGDVYDAIHRQMFENPTTPQAEVNDASWRVYMADSLAVRLVRIAGYEVEMPESGQVNMQDISRLAVAN